MKWGNVKWILILCLLVTDIFLGIQLARQYMGAHTVDPAAVENAAELLSASGILIAPDTVPTAVDRDYVYRIPVSGAGFEAALAVLADSPVTGTYLQLGSSGMTLMFRNGDSAEYYQNLYFTYRHGTEEEGTAWAETVRQFLAGEAVFPEGSGPRAREAEKAAADCLSSMTGSGSVVSGVRFRPETVGIYRTDGENGYLIVFREELSRSGSRNGAAISGTQVCVLTKDGTVRYLAGTWIPFLPDETFSTDKLDQLNILFSEMRRKSGSVSPDSPQRITGIERISYMLWEDSGTLWLRPAWRLEYRWENGGDPWVTLCDAVTGGVVSETVHPSAAETAE